MPNKRPFFDLQTYSAFTLVELLVVIAIVGLLMACLVPVLGNARAASYSIVCKSNLRQVGMALQMYANDSGDHLPDGYTVGGWLYRRAVGMKNPADPFSLPENYGLQAVLEEHGYIAKSASLWICPAATPVDKAYGNTYVVATLAEPTASFTMEQRMSDAHRDTYLVYDNMGSRPYYTGLRRGPTEPTASFVLPPSEYRLPHTFMIKSKSGGTNGNGRRGAVNILFLDGGVGSALYDTNPDDPTGPPLCTLIR